MAVLLCLKVAFSRDFFPHIGSHRDIFYALGYCGHGIALATLLGEQLAELVLGGEASPLLSGNPFRAFPLYRGHPWFLPLVHHYHKLLDALA